MYRAFIYLLKNTVEKSGHYIDKYELMALISIYNEFFIQKKEDRLYLSDLTFLAEKSIDFRIKEEIGLNRFSFRYYYGRFSKQLIRGAKGELKYMMIDNHTSEVVKRFTDKKIANDKVKDYNDEYLRYDLAIQEYVIQGKLKSISETLPILN